MSAKVIYRSFQSYTHTELMLLFCLSSAPFPAFVSLSLFLTEQLILQLLFPISGQTVCLLSVRSARVLAVIHNIDRLKPWLLFPL